MKYIENLDEVLKRIPLGKLHIVSQVIDVINSLYNADIVTLSRLNCLIKSTMNQAESYMETCFIKPDCSGNGWYLCDKCAMKIKEEATS